MVTCGAQPPPAAIAVVCWLTHAASAALRADLSANVHEATSALAGLLKVTAGAGVTV